MAAYTFSALFLAHVLADYVLQTGWIVANKRRASAMALHMSLVFGAMCLTTLTFSPWFIGLTIAHLWIDTVKTYAMPEGLVAYILDQALHVISVVSVALLAPEIWSYSPLAEIPNVPLYFMIAGGVLFAVRGGQYAVAMLLPEPGSPGGVLIGWLERTAICILLIGGSPFWVGTVLGAKALQLGLTLNGRDKAGRRRLVYGSAISLAWGFAVAVPLALVMPMMSAPAP
ncbi:DUF3307 domain-containing protein [Gymnodinialimonas sp. 2305UL16-5]|uniref:DUF3307 domain-containing protein n=1 Tax=Gymnodinialimonas mytili TaxID=3126503 RepID=UPI0030ADCECF